MESNYNFEVGDFAQQVLVTDTRVFEVIAISPSGKTLTVRSTDTGDVVAKRDNGSPYPVVYREVLPDENGAVYKTRVGKDGFFRVNKGHTLRPVNVIDGKPVQRTDYSF